ncbi:MAG: hypothetical protein RL352_1323 [Actinomycetota bacterium]
MRHHIPTSPTCAVSQQRDLHSKLRLLGHTMCCWLVRRAPVSRCLLGVCRAFFRRSATTKHSRAPWCTPLPMLRCHRAVALLGHRFDHRTTPSLWSGSSVAARRRCVRVRSRWRARECCFLTNLVSSPRACSMRYVSRSKKAWFACRGRAPHSRFLRDSCSLPRRIRARAVLARQVSACATTLHERSICGGSRGRCLIGSICGWPSGCLALTIWSTADQVSRQRWSLRAWCKRGLLPPHATVV